ncbi:MAG: ABC transporter ATP-binding protein [Actinomycetes bacterium]
MTQTPPSAAAARDSSGSAGGSDAPVLEVSDLKVHFPLHGSFAQRLLNRGAGAVQAVDGVSFTVDEGEVLGVVGESGSGKTTLGRALLGLARPTSGSIRFHGQEIASLTERQFRPLRRRLQMVFQDPHASLNPSMDIETAVAHPLRIHHITRSPEETQARVCEALERVGLSPVERFLHKYPGDLSGGQKQRAVIARAIILGPELLVADEPVSMLDMSVRAKILELMLGLRRDLGLTYVYITHDLATAKFFCDRVAIMYLGRIVEIGRVEDIFADPQHPYTKALLRAVPEPDPTKALPRDLPRGEIPDAVAPPLGCAFHPRCTVAFGPCGWESRDLRALLEQRWVQAGEDVYESERALFGDLATLDLAGHEVTVPTGTGTSPQDLLTLLRRIRDEQPEEPLWSGVRTMEATDEGVAVSFHDGIDPRLYPTAKSEAACLLYDADVVSEAERATTRRWRLAP